MSNRQVRGWLAGLLAGLLGLGALACSGEDAAPGVAAKPLYAEQGTILWSGGQVPVCFANLPTSTEVQWLKSALKDSWSAAARVDFTYSSSCPFPGKTQYVRVTLGQDTGWAVGGVTSPAGVNPAGVTDVQMGYCTTSDCTGAHFIDYQEAFKQTAVHEMGHALGFAHEQERLPSSTPECPIDNGFRSPGGVQLTSYFDDNSIMNYCRGWDGSEALGYQEGYKAAERISGGDVAGVQAAYGKRWPFWFYPNSTVLTVL